VRRLGLAQELLPEPEPDHDVVRNGEEGVEEVRLLPHQLRRDFGHHAPGRLHGQLAAAVEHRGVGEEVVVVCAVEGVEAVSPDLVDVRQVGGDGTLVGRHRFTVVSEPDVDVRGHVEQMPRSRHQRPQTIGRLERPLRGG